MKIQIDPLIIQNVVAAIDAAYQEGCPVASYDPKKQVIVAKVAIRRWISSSRRGVKPDIWDDRIMDLAKGLIASFEADRKLVGPLIVDYKYLARKIADAIEQKG